MSEIDLQGESEQSIVAALRQGRQEMLGKLYDAYAPVMLGVIKRIVGDGDVAEEVLKDTFVAIWSRIGVYNSSKERLLSWGLSIARGLALQAVKTDRYAAVLKAKNGQAKPVDVLNNNVTLRDSAKEKQVLANLSPLARQALELLYLKGRTCAETAAELNIPVEQLRETLKMAFNKLKAEKSE